MAREYVLNRAGGSSSHLQIDYANELNPQQLAAVTAPPGPALVIAGAGAGKTRTLTYRVAYLLEQGIPPDRILLLTFTNKAAREMMRRVADLLAVDQTGLWGGTFHSIGNRVLHTHTEAVGLKRAFSILDQEDARDVIKACLGELEGDVKGSRFPKADVLQEMFSLAVNKQIPLKEFILEDFEFFSDVIPRIEAIAQRYGARKLATGVVDFDDLLVLWLKLMRENEEVRTGYQRKFMYVLVDEYQDTNKLQAELIDLIAAQTKNIMVVGDDSQSIYSWRGANFQNILSFPERYANAQVYKIETNYRSTPEILTLANAAIQPNLRQFKKELLAVRPSGLKPALVVCPEGADQAAFVAQRALELREEGVNLGDMAVLYRSHFHALELQLELTKRNIPFNITSGIRFFEQAHIKDVAAYLKLMVNAQDELSFKRITSMMPGVGPIAAAKLWDGFAADLRKSGATASAAALKAISAKAPKKAVNAWSNLVATFEQLEALPQEHRASAAIRLVLEAGYADQIKEEQTKARNRLEDLEQLAQFARQFDLIEDFLTQLALLGNAESEGATAKVDASEMIRLTTIHQAKGLEFDVVFVIMLCDGMFPSARSLETTEGEEEERRLFYVSVTRAKNELYLCYPLMRFTQSMGGDFMQQPSRFLNDIPRELVEEWELKRPNPFM